MYGSMYVSECETKLGWLELEYKAGTTEARVLPFWYRPSNSRVMHRCTSLVCGAVTGVGMLRRGGACVGVKQWSGVCTWYNPASPLGAGSGTMSFFPLPSNPPLPLRGRVYASPYPLPLDLDGAPREALERSRWPKMAPRGPQRAQDGLQYRSR